MKKRMLFIPLIVAVFAVTLMAVPEQTVSYTDAWGLAGFSLGQRTTSNVMVNFSIEEFHFGNVTINREELQSITLQNVFLQNDEGAPNLPGNGSFIAIPQGSRAEFRIVDSRVERYSDIDLAPAPRIPLETEDGPLEYSRNQNIYSQNAFYPASPVMIGEQSLMRGVDIVMLGITPFQYNPFTKELLVYRDLKVEINFIGGNGQYGAESLRSRWWDPILEDRILNFESLPDVDYSMTGLSRDGAEYLIICPDDATFLAWADSVKVFRTKQGIETVIKTTTEVGGNNATAIENYINSIMDPNTGWDPAPAAILLMGDYGTTGNTVVSPIYNGYCVSDNIYADVSGNSMPDVILARMTAQNETHLQTMVTKFLDYERTPPTNPDFYNHPVTALGWQTARWFQICSEAVGGYFLHEQGKNPVRINAIYSGNPNSDPWSTNQNTSMVVNVFGPNDLGYIPATPAELGGWTGGNATMVNNAINSGSFLLQHRDHGGTDGWGEPNYDNNDINGLTNSDLVFVFSINCLTGKYNIGGECFAEKFHRYTYNGENAGALGIIAASEVSYSFVNDTFVWGMYDHMWPNFLPSFNTTPLSRGVLPAFANAAGKYFLQASAWPYNTNNKEVTYNLFHHHGDAFTTLYSEVPQDLSVVHNPVLMSGVSTFNVTANDGSLIALSVDGELIGTAAGTGSPVSVQIEAQLPPTIVDIVITMQNYYRYETAVQVIPPSGPYVVFDSYTIQDDNGNGDGLADYGENIFLDMGIHNVGNEIANNVELEISTNDAYITLIDFTESCGVVNANAVVFLNDAFELDIANDVPDGHVANFTLTVTGSAVWESYFSIGLHAPELIAENYEINDIVGNGNGMMDPGETIEFSVMTENIGSSLSPFAVASLTCANPLITISDENYDLGEILSGGSEEAFFSINIDPAMQIGSTITLMYEVNAGEYSVQNAFPQTVGLIIEDFESNGFETFDWEFGGNANWTISTDAYEGFYSAKSGTIGNSQTSTIYLEANVIANGDLSFFKKVSSESNWDYLKFYIDGNLQDDWSGNIAWGEETYSISVGEHIFKWEYYKDGSVSTGSDCAWIDYIVFPSMGSGGIVSGVVSDANSGNPIAGAIVAGMTVSSTDGSYTFNIDPGTYDFTCTADGYFDLIMEDVVVIDGEVTTLDFEMLPSDPPQNVAAEIVDYNDILLTWDAPEARSIVRSKRDKKQKNNSRDSRSLTEYLIYRDNELIEELNDPTALSYLDENLDAGDYSYYIEAVYENPNGASGASNVADAEVVFSAPINVTASSVGLNVLIEWNDMEPGFEYYKVYRDNDLIATDITENSYEDENLEQGTYIYNVTTVFEGGFESELSENAEIEHTDANGLLIPTETALNSNYPNPFNPETTINFALSNSGKVQLSIYNTKGQLVKQLVNTEMQAGYHNVIWSGKDDSGKQVSSGMYLYKMQSGDYSETKKMILMK